MTTNDIKNEIKTGSTARVRRAVRNALRNQLVAAIRAGFSADCDLDNYQVLVFSDSAVIAESVGVLNCRDHTFRVAVPYSDIAEFQG